MASNYNIMANYIVSKYIERVSGKDLGETFVDDDPSKRVMVGMLSEDRVEAKFEGGYVENTNTRFDSIPSISISFIVKKNESGILHVIPAGLLFYMVQPSYEKTVQYMLERYSEKDSEHYTDILQLCECYPEIKFNLPLTYKKIDIASVMADGIEIKLSDITPGQTFHLKQKIAEKLSVLADQIANEICIVSQSRISFFDLTEPDRFRVVTGIKDERVQPRWDIDIVCNVKEEGNTLRFLLQMVNTTPINDKKNIGYLPKIFDAGIRVKGNEGIEFQNIPLDYFSGSYKERNPIFAVTENASAKYHMERNEIRTDNIPIYYQKRLVTKDDLKEYVTFAKLIQNPIVNLNYILLKMEEDYGRCEDDFESRRSKLSSQACLKYQNALREYENEISRFHNGIKQIEYKDFVRKAFYYMNKTFQTKLDGQSRNITGWRLFQIVFIVSMIGEVIHSEYRDDASLTYADIDVANLLYFPTGGGKTEAFLGITVFAMFFDRLRGKTQGITAFLKYPLRLLAVQQLDRILAIVMQANVVRQENIELALATEFRVGFYVGKDNTPNKISKNEKLSSRGERQQNLDLLLESDQDTLNEYYRFIDKCPCCGKKMINVRFNKERWVLEHICDNPDCPADVLPLFIVDSEIYCYLPSIVVSTIDKMSLIGISNEFKALFGQVKCYCPIHGFSTGSKCTCAESGCSGRVQAVGYLKDPVPTLFIQDEMHLIKESLGTFDAHYESFLYYYAKRMVKPDHRKKIRFIGATATISMYQEHIRNLYHMEPKRFPCEYPSVKNGEDFYSYTDENDITRIILGYAPYGRSITDGMWESVYFMRRVVYHMMDHLEESYETLKQQGFTASIEEYQNMLFDYWIELVYNNRKQDAIELENAFQNQANNRLAAKNIPLYVIKQMTSDVDFQTVRKTLFDIQTNKKNTDSTNLILATSTISHGVDEDSFNIMYFFGMPNNNAEYIQAYSRTGRKYTGIVIDIIRLMRVRDRSYLKNFVTFHQNKDDLVESVPINRWAKNAIYSTLPGILSGVIMQYYTILTDTDHLYHAVKVKKMLMDGIIRPHDVINMMIAIYDCRDNEKMSLVYKEIISEEVTKILDGIQNGNFTKEEFLSTAIGRYSHGKLMPMRSLRDTEEQIEIKLR
ncbi:MAG: helicase-related protein [Clostridium sp.]